MELTKEAIAFAELGRLSRLSIEFADGSSVVDPSVLSDVADVIKGQYKSWDADCRILKCTLDGDTFRGEFSDRINLRLVKRYQFTATPTKLSYKLINPEVVENFAEDFAVKRTKPCPKGTICGGGCISAKKECTSEMSPEQKAAHQKALRKAGTVDTSLAKKRRQAKETRITEAKAKEAAEKEKAKTKGDRSTAKRKPASVGAKKEAKPKTKVHSVTKQEDFEDLVMHSYGKLAKTRDDLVPVYKLRREVGELVPRDKFNTWLKDMQAKDKLRLLEGSVEDSAPDKIKDSITTKASGLRCYVKLDTDGETALERANKRSTELEKTLKDRPDLDPLGTASQLQKGPKLKSQSDFEKTADDAYKRINNEFNHDNLVPITDVRKAMGDRVSKKEFDDYLLKMQADDKVQLIGDDDAPKDIEEGGLQTKSGSKKAYIKKL